MPFPFTFLTFFKIYWKLNYFTFILDLMEENKEKKIKKSAMLINHFLQEMFIFIFICASQHCRLHFQVQEVVLCKMRCVVYICVELFWNSVVNTT